MLNPGGAEHPCTETREAGDAYLSLSLSFLLSLFQKTKREVVDKGFFPSKAGHTPHQPSSPMPRNKLWNLPLQIVIEIANPINRRWQKIRLTKIKMNTRDKWIEKEHEDNKSQHHQAFGEQNLVWYPVLWERKTQFIYWVLPSCSCNVSIILRDSNHYKFLLKMKNITSWTWKKIIR